MEQEERQVITQTFYLCPICKQSYTKKEEAEKCFERCKQSYLSYVRLTMSVNLASGEYIFTINDDSDYFERGEDELKERLKKIDVFHAFDHVDFTARCLTRSEIPETTTRLRQYFIDWCMAKVNYMKKMMEK